MTHTHYKLFNNFGLLTEAEITHILSYFKPKSHKTGTILVNFGEINDKLYFIEKGILREFSEQEQDNTITHWLIPENSFAYLIDSFLEQKPSKIALEVIEDTKLWEIAKTDMDKLYETIPQVGFIGKLMVERYIKNYEEFIRMLRLTPEKRVEWYYTYHTDLSNRVPLKYVATYLHMTPSTLSRVRKKMASRKYT